MMERVSGYGYDYDEIFPPVSEYGSFMLIPDLFGVQIQSAICPLFEGQDVSEKKKQKTTKLDKKKLYYSYPKKNLEVFAYGRRYATP
jgi:hypothetical protein